MSIHARSSLFLFLGLLLSFFIVSSLKKGVPFIGTTGTRSVLATLHFDSNDSHFKVIKLQSGRHIHVEIYALSNEDNKLFAQFDFINKKDLLYDFKNSVTNLFVADIDNDKNQEILVPMLDNNLNSEVSIIHYSPSEKRFYLN